MSTTDQPNATTTALERAISSRYRIARELGKGGMATVFLAHDLKHDRPVAIKVLHPELGAVLGAERFLAEIRITARLSHPHILPLLDSGRASAADGVPEELLYYVMPYVPGETLRDRLDREQQLPVGEAVRIARDVLSALAYAHTQGVIHRDIKPENILLGAPNAGAPPPVLLADFGIARVADGGNRLTSTGVTIGTAAYMSPEQATAERELDGRSDIYSFGCVLYEMLAGEPPFTGPNARSILAKALSEPVRPVRRVRDGVPPHLDAALATALGRAPADRFPDAGSFASALDASSAPAATAVTTPRRLKPRLVAAGVGAVALGGAAWMLLSRPNEAVAAMPSVRIERFKTNDTANAYLAATLQEDLISALQETHSARIFAMDSAKLPKGFAVSAVADRVKDTVEVRLRVFREETGEVVGTPVVREPVSRESALPGLAADTVLRLVGGRRRAAVRAVVRAPSTRDSMAYDLFLRGRYQADRRTEGTTQRAVAFFRAAIARDSNFAEGWAGLTRSLAFANQRGFRIPGVRDDSLVPLLVDASQRALDADSTRSYVWLARAIAFREIEPTSRRSQIEALMRAVTLDSNNADGWHYLAVAWEDSLEPTRALDAFRRALRIDPTHRQALGFIAMHFMWARQLDSAKAWGETGKRVDPAHILIRQGAGQVELLLGDTARAAEDYRAEMRVSNGPDEGFALGGLADLAAREGNRAAADTLIRQAMASIDSLHPTMHEAVFTSFGLAGVGQKDRAIRLLSRYRPRADAHFQMHLQRDPLLDPLRAMPAFKALIVRKDQIRGG